MDKKEKLLQKRVAGLFALLCVIFFQFFDSDHLFLKEEVVSVASLPEVLVGYWGKPAWLACSMAKVLTSLFVPVGGGAVLITAVLMLEWWASLFILRKFNVGDMAPLYALFPVVMEWGTYCSPYYHLNSILSLVIVLYIFCGYIQIKVKWLLGDGVYFVVCGLLYGGEPVVYFCNPCAVVRGGNRREALGVLGFAVDNGYCAA